MFTESVAGFVFIILAGYSGTVWCSVGRSPYLDAFLSTGATFMVHACFVHGSFMLRSCYVHASHGM